MTRPAIVRLTVAIPLTFVVVVTFAVLGHPTVRGATAHPKPVHNGTTINLAQYASSVGEGTHLRFQHNGKIAYVLNTPTGAWIETINPDGTHDKRFTQVCGYYMCGDAAYAWSPDDRRMALWRNRYLTSCSRRPCVSTPATIELSLVVMDANGTGEKQLERFVGRCAGWACDRAFVFRLSWSPDGKQIAYSRPASHCGPRRPSCEDSLYIANTSTGRPRRLTYCASPACFDTMPAWAPDGARIVFVRNGSLFMVNANGSGLKKLPELGGATGPSWSPDGMSIAFQSHDQLYSIHPDGSALRPLTQLSRAAPPIWSPDGRHIAFITTEGHPGGGNGEVWVMNSNGSHLKRVYRARTPLGEPTNGPAWSPDGKYIAFEVHQAIPYGLTVIDANGGHLHVLVDSGGEAPRWQPVP
jgi:TolB protein